MATKTKPVKKALTKKAPTKKASTKKALTKKAPTKKASTKKTLTKRAPTKSTSAKKSLTKKAPTKKVASHKENTHVARAKKDAATGLRELFENELKDIYWAEKALTKAIPSMIKNATSEDLAEALQDHLRETEVHITRLEEVFETVGLKIEGKKCEAMAGLIKEAEEIMAETEKGDVRDAGIILAGQKVEHYEIATYGTLCAFARIMGEDKVAAILHDTLDEEKEVDEKLTEIAMSSINVEALVF